LQIVSFKCAITRWCCNNSPGSEGIPSFRRIFLETF